MATDAMFAFLARQGWKQPQWCLLSHVECGACGPQLTDAGVAALAAAAPRLHTLLLHGATSVGDDSAAALARCCPLLRRVAVTRSRLTDAGFRCLGSLR